MSLQKEINFEDEVCDHLRAHGWLYAKDDAQNHDRARAIFPPDVVAWVQATQPKVWESLTKNHGGKAEETLLDRLRVQLDQRGTLDVLRNGVELVTAGGLIRVAQFRPALSMNQISSARASIPYGEPSVR